MAAKLSGGGGGNKRVIESNSDINVTPFVDIMLVLLIIFMVSIPPPTASIKLDMPPPTPPKPGEKPKEPSYISVSKDGKLYIVDKETSLEALPAALAAKIGGSNPQGEQVLIRADADVEYARFMEVLNTLQDSGFLKIGLINEDIS